MWAFIFLKMLNILIESYISWFKVLWMLTCIHFCNSHHYCQVAEQVHQLEELLCAISLTLPWLPTPGNHSFFFITIVLFFWELSYKGSHIVCNLLKLDLFTQHDVFTTQPCCKCWWFVSFYYHILFLCMDVPQIVYAFTD